MQQVQLLITTFITNQIRAGAAEREPLLGGLCPPFCAHIYFRKKYEKLVNFQSFARMVYVQIHCYLGKKVILACTYK